MKTNIRLILTPVILCYLLVSMQNAENLETKSYAERCGIDGMCAQLSEANEVPPMLHIPPSNFRAVRTDFMPFADLPDGSCRSKGSCPVTILFTGNNQNLGGSIFYKPFQKNLIYINIFLEICTSMNLINLS